MRPLLRRTNYKGIRFFHFDLANESHARLLQSTRKIDPMAEISKVTRIDEY